MSHKGKVVSIEHLSMEQISRRLSKLMDKLVLIGASEDARTLKNAVPLWLEITELHGRQADYLERKVSDLNQQVHEMNQRNQDNKERIMEIESTPMIENMQPRFSDEGKCLCPICGSDYVHLQAVEVNAGGMVSQINHQHPVVRQGPPWGRGTLIRIMFWAECGHSWTVQHYFHKGQTWAQVDETMQDFDKLTDMWRT